MSNIDLRYKNVNELDVRASVTGTDRVAVFTTTGSEPESATIDQIAAQVSGSKVYLNIRMADVSTADTVYVASPVAGTITNMWSIVDGTTATAAAVITGKIAAAAITNGVITIASGAVAGEVDTAAPTAANTVAVGDNINLTTSGASTNTVAAEFTIEITLT